MIRIARSGRYFRVANPLWIDPLDPSYAKRYGGRWTPKGQFGALYLNAGIDVAAANARWQHRDRAIQLFDLRPESRPALITLAFEPHEVVDVVTGAGLADIGFPSTYPIGVSHAKCHAIARTAYAGEIQGVACRSAAEATEASWIGEELTVFDRALPLAEIAPRRRFAEWYPDAKPDDASG